MEIWVIVVWIAVAIFTGAVASSKGRSAVTWFILALFFSVLALLAVGLMSKPPELTKFNSKQCPKCAEQIRYDASVCRHCGHEFDPQDVAETVKEKRAAIKHANMFVASAVLVLIAVVIGAIVG